MTRWTRTPRLPARVSRWINFVRAALQDWTQHYRRLYEAWFALAHARRQRTVRLGLEALEVRELLNASFGGLDTAALVSDFTQLRNDFSTSAVSLLNAAQPAQANTRSIASLQSQWYKSWNVLAADWSQTWRDFVQFEDAALQVLNQEFHTLLNDLGIQPSSSTTNQAAITGAGLGQQQERQPPTTPPSLPPTGSGGSTTTRSLQPLLSPPPPTPTVYLYPSTVQASETNSGTVNIGVNLSAPSQFTVTVQYATSDGTAKAGKDYIAASGTITIPAGQGGG